MATSNPFDVTNSQTQSGGLVSSANPALTGARATGTGSATTARPAQQSLRGVFEQVRGSSRLTNPPAPSSAPTPAPPPPIATPAAAQIAATPGATAGQAQTTRAGAAQADATQASLDPRSMTVQGQLEQITSRESPLFQQAMTRAAQQMAQRGLVNSSMGVTAAESALLDSAMPIATADARTFQDFELANTDIANQFELTNTGARNDASQFNAGEANQTSRFNADARTNTSQFNAGQQAQIARDNANAQNQMILQTLDANTRTGLVNIEANYRTLMQASQSASDLYRQSIDSISSITRDPELSAEAKQAAIRQQTQLLQNGMNLLGAMNALNVSDLLQFDSIAPPATPGSAPAPAPAPGGGWGSTPAPGTSNGGA